MKKLLILLVILLLPAVAAETQQEIANAQEVTIDAKVSSTIDVERTGANYNVDYVRAELYFFPKNEYNQQILKSSTDPKATEEKNMILFEWKDLGLPTKLAYSLDTTIIVKNNFPRVQEKISYPISVPAEAAKYLEPTEVIDSRHDLIIEQSTRLAEGEDDLFILVSKIAAWTKNTIDYNLSTLTAEVSQPASWVLENRKGVCDELTSLFIAMLRALGIPAKFISGLSHTNSPLFPSQWGAHGWAEVYFPGVGWLPFDPTFGEYGWVDPGHIKMKESTGPKEPSIKFEWKGRDVSVDAKSLDLKGEIKTVTEGKPVISLDARGAKDDVGIGTYNLAILNITNLQDY